MYYAIILMWNMNSIANKNVDNSSCEDITLKAMNFNFIQWGDRGWSKDHQSEADSSSGGFIIWEPGILVHNVLQSHPVGVERKRKKRKMY